jgi:hypothetical protein
MPDASISCIILHSSTDKPIVSELVRLARRDLPQYDVWYDDRDMDLDHVVDDNITRRIAEARVAIFCVGPGGLGPYQTSIEVPLLQKRLEAMASVGPPLRLIPVLLPGGWKVAMPPAMTTRSIVNWDRTCRDHNDLWPVIQRRVTLGLDEPAGAPETLIEAFKPTVERLAEAAMANAGLTVFIGAYGHAPDNVPAGQPGTMTDDLLKLLGWPGGQGHAVPWPSEAATWAGIAQKRTRMVTELKNRALRASNDPSDLMQSVSNLAERWNKIAEVANVAMQQRNWRLLLMSTQLDQQLETSLLRKNLRFFRILPTVKRNRGYRAERWVPGLPPQPVAASIVTDKRTALSAMTIDDMNDAFKDTIDLVLVKLCGTLDDPASLVISSADFLELAPLMGDLPSDVLGWAQQNPLLMLGSGLSSPLALLVKSRVLPAGPTDSRPTIWVANDEPQDTLGRLEDQLLDLQGGIDGFRQALGLSHLARGPQYAFVRDLVKSL